MNVPNKSKFAKRMIDKITEDRGPEINFPGKLKHILYIITACDLIVNHYSISDSHT